MIRRFYTCVLLATVLFTACSKDNGIDPVVPYQPIPAQSEMGNLQNTGCVTSDKDNIYFYHFDTEGVKLYAKNRETAKLTVLDAITTPKEGGDMLFTNLYCHGGYLYYSPFDINGNRKNTIWRVKTDGSAKEGVVANPCYDIIYYKDKIYYQFDGLFSVNMDGSGSAKLFNEAGQMAVNDDKLYYLTYGYEQKLNKHTTYLHCCALDGTSGKQLVQFEGSIIYTFGSDKIYAMIGSANTYSLVEMKLDGSGKKEILSSLPHASFATFGNILFLALDGNSRYKAGIYNYKPGYKMLMPVLLESCMYFYFTGDNQIVYGYNDDKVGRFPQFYQTDFTGKKGIKLFN